MVGEAATVRAGWRSRLPRRTVRLQLAALYASVLAISGAALLGITVVALFGFHAEASRSIAAGVNAQGQHTVISVLHSNQFAKDFAAIMIGGGTALAALTVASAWIGWLLAGRVLKPLRSITTAAREISATNLHRRLALVGPDDELKELGDTFDGLLERLDASFSSQRRFVANASHELRTPLARLKTLTQVALADPNADTASLRTAHERVLASEERLEELIDALLTLARGEEELRVHERIDLARVAEQSLGARTAEIDALGLRVDAPLSPAWTTGDLQLLERLIENLVDNAIRHNAPGGWIEVATSTRDGGAVLSVASSGAPVSAEELERIKQPFARNGSERTGNGHGLGLSIVHAIAAAHKASVEMQASPDGGLHVEVQFPVDLQSSGSGA
jgi:signal transduction histidine kinase